MLIRKQYKIEKLAAEQDGYRPMRHVMFDADKGRMIATNGHALVSIPVTTQTGDKSGMVSVEAIKAAQKKSKKETDQKSRDWRELVGELECEQDELTVTDGPKFKRPKPSDCPDRSKPDYEQGNFPPYEQVMVSHDPEADDVVELGFNVKLLLELAQAMGESGAHMGVKLRFKIHRDKKTGKTSAPHDPIQVFVADKGDGEGPEGILMPMRL